MKSPNLNTPQNQRKGLFFGWLAGKRRTSVSEAMEKPAPAVPRGKTILIVDDDQVVLKATTLKLQSDGYTVVTAVDAASAMIQTRTARPDLILLDINFPPDVGAVAWDGFVIMNWLRRLESARRVPIILITAGDPEKYKLKALAAGAAGFFSKPLDFSRLLAQMDEVLARRLEPVVAGTDTVFDI